MSEAHLRCIRMFIKRLHLFCAYQIGVTGNNSSLANTGLTLLEQRNLLVPLQTLKRSVDRFNEKSSYHFSCFFRTCVDTYIRQPLYTLLQIGIVRCPLDERYKTLLFIWYTYIRPWRFSPQILSNDQRTTTLLDTTANEDDAVGQDQSIMTTDNVNFVEHNLPFYGRLYQFAIDRLQKTDLTNQYIAELINKLASVSIFFSSKYRSKSLLCFFRFFLSRISHY